MGYPQQVTMCDSVADIYTVLITLHMRTVLV
jgi:hypothetical protein